MLLETVKTLQLVDEWRQHLPLMDSDRKGNERNRCQCKLEFIEYRKLMGKSNNTG